MIGNHQHLHAVAQRELEGVVAGLTGIDRRRRGKFGAVGAEAAKPGTGTVTTDAAIRPAPASKAILEPVKPAAALFLWSARLRPLLTSASALTGLPLSGVTAVQNAIGKAAVGILRSQRADRRSTGANAGIGGPGFGIGQEHLLGRRDNCRACSRPPSADRLLLNSASSALLDGSSVLVGGAPGSGGRRLKSGGITSGALVVTANSSGDFLFRPAARRRSHSRSERHLSG